MNFERGNKKVSCLALVLRPSLPFSSPRRLYLVYVFGESPLEILKVEDLARLLKEVVPLKCGVCVSRKGRWVRWREIWGLDWQCFSCMVGTSSVRLGKPSVEECWTMGV